MPHIRKFFDWVLAAIPGALALVFAAASALEFTVAWRWKRQLVREAAAREA